MPTNDERADWAKDSCRLYADVTGLNLEDEVDVAISDLIASLLHYADREGLCPDTLVARAQMHYEHEAAEESGDEETVNG